VDGESYRLERTFGDKPSGDTFTLYRLPGMVPSNRFSKDIGRELFGLDGDSFERSTYFPQTRERLSLSTDGIQAGLTHLVEDSDDVGHYQRAVDLLRKARSTYQPYRGAGGKVAEAAQQVAQLEEEVEDCRRKEGWQTQLTREIQDIEDQIQENNRLLAQMQGELAQSVALEQGPSLREQRQWEEERERLEEEARSLLARYPKGLPGTVDLDEAKVAASVLKEQNEELPDNVVEAQERLKEGNARFGGHIPDEDTVACAQAAWKECVSHASQKKPWDKGKLVGWILLVLGILSTVMTTVITLTDPSAKPFLFFSMAILITGIYLFQRKKKPGASEPISPEEQLILDLVGETDRDLTVLGEKLTQLKQECSELWYYQRVLAHYDLALQEQEKLHRQKAEGLENFFRRYQLTAFSHDLQGLSEIYADLNESRELERQYARVNATLKRQKKPEMSVEVRRINDRIRALNEEISRLYRQQAEKQQQQRDLAQDTQQETELLRELEHWKEQRKEGQRKVALLDRTISYLEEARQKLSESYLDRLQGGLRRYLAQAWPDHQAVFVDQNLNIKVEQGGAARELGYFSAGSEDLVMLCMRLALVDALYPGKEKPLLILDDPFVNLDEKNTARALNLLRQKAEEEQILYLVCHSSRC
jgi:hypothetical protein